MPGNSVTRQLQILELLGERHSLSIQELVSELGVSAMTVHRDLNTLAAGGRLVKAHGGVSLPPRAPAATGAPAPCAMCNRGVPERSAVIMQSPQHGHVSACCPHCGLALLERGASADLMLVTDFLSCQVVSAADAVYLVGSEVTTCCRPGILAFAEPQAAVRFQKGFGGQIMELSEVRNHLRASMKIVLEW